MKKYYSLYLGENPVSDMFALHELVMIEDISDHEKYLNLAYRLEGGVCRYM
jgi:hypothetical protein